MRANQVTEWVQLANITQSMSMWDREGANLDFSIEQRFALDFLKYSRKSKECEPTFPQDKILDVQGSPAWGKARPDQEILNLGRFSGSHRNVRR